MLKVGDLVSSELFGEEIIFCIMDFKTGNDGNCVAVLKGIYNSTLVVDAPLKSLKNIIITRKL